MMVRPRFLAALLSAAISSAVSPVLPLRADGNVATVLLKTQSDLDSATGLILTPKGSVEKKVSEIRRINDHTVSISFDFAPDEVDSNSVATALAISKEGDVVFGEVMTIKQAASNLASIPECEEDIQLPPGIESQFANLQKLVEVRTQRRVLSQARVGKSISGDTLKKLEKSEATFGLSRPVPLSPALNPVDLVDRLSRIKAALLKLRAAKKAKAESEQ